MALYLGILADSYRRQLRRLTDRPAIEVVLEKIIPVAEEFGIQPMGVDFSVGQLPQTDRSYLDELKGRLAEHHLIPTVIVGTLVLHADRELSEPALTRTIKNLEVAHYLGSPLGLFYFSYAGRVTREGRIRLATEQIRRLADAALELGLSVTTENYDFFTSDDFLEIFKAVGRANVGLHNDTGNWLILGEDPLEATRKMAPYTYHAHIRDYVLKDGVYTSVPIGQGLVDFSSVLAELKPVAEQRDRLVMAMEMDLDQGDEAVEDQAVRECARYMADWFQRNV
jgi:sugar phosphate isomerase/epimerase